MDEETRKKLSENEKNKGNEAMRSGVYILNRNLF